MSNRVKIRNGQLYAALLVAQTVCTVVVFWLIFPIFNELVTHLGEPQILRIPDQILIIFFSGLLHCLYWSRLRWFEVVAPFHNILVAHVCSFASRISFFFGGALFSAVFFRHLPELEAFPPLGQMIAKAIYVAGVLFGLFCYSLELDRLGRAIEGEATR